MHRYPLISISALALAVAAACTTTSENIPARAAPPEPPAEPAPAVSAPEPTSEPSEEAGEPKGEVQDVQAQALEECQAASEFLDAEDVSAAIARIDRCYALMMQLPEEADDAFAQAKQDIRLLVAELVGRAYRAEPASASAPMTSWDLGLPMIDNAHVQRELRSFTTVERAQFLDAYRRSGRFRPMILAKLEAAGLPSQLSWLPLVESLFKVNALSRASALGLWQFISSTGLRYGLKRDTWVDERLDPEKSTDSAIAYLMELHRMFGDWPKALAAYNCGEGRIHALQNRSTSEYLDFWDMYARLPDETRRYVPRLIAAIQIIENPERYGITLPEPDAPLEETASVPIERSVRLDALEKALGLDPGAISERNPELRHKATPATAYQLRVPAERASDVPTAAAALAKYEPPKVEYVTHRVRSGETLSTIAERYRTSVNAILQANRLRSAHRIWPGQRLRIPSRN